MQQLMRWEPFSDTDEFFRSLLQPGWHRQLSPGESNGRRALTLEGERKEEKEAKGQRSHRIERMYGHFSRRFTLPDDAAPTRITANSKDGIVTIHIPKRPVKQRKAREIAVQ